jgi:hypothetical protein
VYSFEHTYAGVHSPLGAVFVGLWPAEIDQQRIAEQLGHMAVVTGNVEDGFLNTVGVLHTDNRAAVIDTDENTTTLHIHKSDHLTRKITALADVALELSKTILATGNAAIQF